MFFLKFYINNQKKSEPSLIVPGLLETIAPRNRTGSCQMKHGANQQLFTVIVKTEIFDMRKKYCSS